MNCEGHEERIKKNETLSFVLFASSRFVKKKLKKSVETQIAESLHDRTPTENQLKIFLGAKGELDS